MVADTVAPWAEPAPVTATALLHLPEDGWRYELVKGRLVRMPPTGYEHGKITPRILQALLQFVDEHQLGVVCGSETGFLLSREGQEDTVLAPDAAFISAARAPKEPVPGFARLAPDLVCEVASPDQTQAQMAAKARLYLDSGCRLVWVVWPRARRVDIWTPDRPEPDTVGESDDLYGANVLPGLALPVRTLFR
jgi:Uma2 family endonuclease